jgi:hypothetical protein
MADQNIWDPNPPPAEEPNPDNDSKPTSNMRVVGFNLLALAVYIIILSFAQGRAAPYSDALILAIHVIVCIVVAIAAQKWVWLLSALTILVIGFSTCFGILWRLD